MLVSKNLIYLQVWLKSVEHLFSNQFQRDPTEQLIHSINRLLLERVMKMIYSLIKSNENKSFESNSLIY